VSEEFVGSGWAAFPMRTDPTGAIALVSREQELEEAMRVVMATAPGERPMRPEFGCGIHDYVFAPADATTAGLIAYEVRASLLRWEPRVEIKDVDVRPDPDDPSTMLIEIKYTVKDTNDPRNLVFPFYVIPAEEGSDSTRALPVTTGSTEE
jgi:phage baseplate assembly protein W